MELVHNRCLFVSLPLIISPPFPHIKTTPPPKHNIPIPLHPTVTKKMKTNRREKGFIARSWHITSKSMFAGSCIGVILLVMSLEFLRRASREYDNYIYRQYQKSLSSTNLAPSTTPSSSTSLHAAPKGDTTVEGGGNGERGGGGGSMNMGRGKFRPNLMQQMIRATFHMVQFTIAYFVMLLAMYYNGLVLPPLPSPTSPFFSSFSLCGEAS